MSKGFYEYLKVKDFNWDEAVKEFMGRTDMQIIWLNMLIKTEEAKRKAREKSVSSSRRKVKSRAI